MRDSQADQILSYMRQHGSITPMIALRRFGCFRLASRILELKRRGHFINSVLVSRGGRRYAAYSLVEGRRKAA